MGSILPSRLVQTFRTPLASGVGGVLAGRPTTRVHRLGLQGSRLGLEKRLGGDDPGSGRPGPPRLFARRQTHRHGHRDQNRQALGRRLGQGDRRLTGDLFRFHCVTFSHDGKLLAAGGGDWDGNGPSQVTLWDVKTMKQVGKLPTLRPVLGLAFSPDDRTIVTGGSGQRGQVVGRRYVQGSGVPGGPPGLGRRPGVLRRTARRWPVPAHDATIRIWDLRKRAEVSSSTATPCGAVRRSSRRTARRSSAAAATGA